MKAGVYDCQISHQSTKLPQRDLLKALKQGGQLLHPLLSGIEHIN